MNVKNGTISPPNGDCNGYIKFRNFKEIKYVLELENNNNINMNVKNWYL